MRPRRALSFLVPMSLPLGAVLCACALYTTQTPWVRDPAQASTPSARAPVLKAHMLSGELFRFSNWQVVDSTRALQGEGERYDAARRRIATGTFTLPTDSIALLETNVREGHYPFGLQALGALTILWGVTSVACLSDPKSCFGSCPTFYASDGTRTVLQAEGFSSSIARVLEARDVDALYRARPRGRRFTIEMANEAQETHVVRTVRVLAVSRAAGSRGGRGGRGGRVFASPDGRFYPTAGVRGATSCVAAEGDCLAAVRDIDSLERRSLADSTDLAARETVELTFPAVAGPWGVVVGARQTFVSTFVFYHTLAAMGHQAGEWFALLERLGPRAIPQATGLTRVLGGIEVAVLGADGAWRVIGTYNEAGPIASDLQVLPADVTPTGGLIHVRLRLAQGSWRVGYVAVAGLGEAAAPVVLDPVVVQRGGADDPAALAALRDTARFLVTSPGDRYRLGFDLPPDPRRYELFLESRGYYYEWIRDEWLRDEDPAMVGLIMADPAAALRKLADSFKQVEPNIERLFWESRFGR